MGRSTAIYVVVKGINMEKNYKNALLNFRKLADFYIKNRSKNKSQVEEILGTSYKTIEELVQKRSLVLVEDDTCPSCGVQIENNYSYCPECGQHLFSKKAYQDLESELYEQFGDRLEFVKTILQEKNSEEIQEELQ